MERDQLVKLRQQLAAHARVEAAQLECNLARHDKALSTAEKTKLDAAIQALRDFADCMQ